MKKLLLFLFVFLFPLALCSNSSKLLTEYLDEVYLYDAITNIDYDTYNQKLDIYFPTNYGSDPTDVRPLFVYVHGGSFQYGSKNNSECEFLCENMAKRGYIAISINYRLATGTVTHADRLNAAQDLNSVLSLVQYAIDNPDDNPLTVHANSRMCTIDGDRILVGGDSAGGLICFMAIGGDSRDMTDDARFLFASDPAQVQGMLTLWTPFTYEAGSTFNVAPYDDFIQTFPMFICHGDLDAYVDVSNSQDLVYYSNSNPNITYIEFSHGVHGAWINGDPNTTPANGQGFYYDADSAWYAWAKNLLGL